MVSKKEDMTAESDSSTKTAIQETECDSSIKTASQETVHDSSIKTSSQETARDSSTKTSSQDEAVDIIVKTASQDMSVDIIVKTSSQETARDSSTKTASQDALANSPQGKTSQGRVKERAKFFTAKNLTKLAVFTALSYVLYLFVKFPLPFIFPSFFDFQISDVPALLAGFSIGPVAGIVVVVLKCLLKMPMSSTACVGELADILIGCAFVLPSALIYKKHRSQKGAVAALAVGAGCSVVMSLLSNAFILIPFYVRFMFHGNWQILLNMVGNLFPSITVKTFYLYYLPLSVLPFNILRCALSSTVTFALYKKLSRFFDLLLDGRKSNEALLKGKDANHHTPE